ncbi:hypothetical protein V8E51_016756 [Hyaloscypha variabilis]
MLSHHSIKELLHRILGRAPAIPPALEAEWAREREALLQDLRSIPTPEETLQLHAMPSEVLINIARYLPASYEVCLTLTCRLVLFKLGAWSWEEIDSARQERGRLLLLLDRDLKNLIACHFCQMLHEPVKTIPTERSRTKKMERKCTVVERKRQYGSRRHYFHLLDDITFTEIQHSMKMHLRFGGDCSGLLQRLSNTSPTFLLETIWTWNPYLQLSTLARVISGHLVIRTEYYIVIPWRVVNVSDHPIFRHMKTIEICPHAHDINDERSFPQIWRCSKRSVDWGHCYHCYIRSTAPKNGAPRVFAAPQLRRCDSCPTESQIQVVAVGEALTIAFTVWQDQGDCASPCGTIWEGGGASLGHWREVPDEQGSIKAAFEADSSSNASVGMRALPQLPVKAKGMKSLRKTKQLVWK